MFQARKMTFSQFHNANISVKSGISNVLAVSFSSYIISRFASFASIVVDLWNVLSSLNVPKLLSAALRTPVIRKRSLNVRALYMGVRRKFSRGRARSTFRILIFRLQKMQCKRSFTKPFTLSTQKEISPFYGNSHKKCTSLAAIARYVTISYETNYLQIFHEGYLFAKMQIAMSLIKPQLYLYFTYQDLAASLSKKGCKHLRTRPKQSNTL